ncbi:MAG: class III poly(R)-hydroxyalkanoic acid synthase subunit PhaC [Propionibacteriaceae bacterium]|jgi:polyhydroxyalkanoate synthase|nr:class III poly(R)-hydroxyalkanoic acid synthase subunit PhaC [Propionibacteriaceae bacterium]
MSTYTVDPQKAAAEVFRMSTKLSSGLYNMAHIDDLEIAPTPKELVYTEDLVQVFRYVPVVPKPHAVPVLISYALVNKQYMMDLHASKSMIRKLLDDGIDVYVIDWGYPKYVDRFLTLADYVEGYLDNVVEHIRQAHGIKQVSLLGVCQGATMAACYTSMHQDKVRNFVSLVMPFDFSTDDGLLFKWSRHMDIDAVVEASHNILSGDSMNDAYNMLKPLELTMDKYINFIDKLDDRDAVVDFLRMEYWIYDSPDQAGPMLRQFIKDFYQENKFAKGTLEIAGQKADPKAITCPVLVMLAQKDHLVPPASTRPFMDAVSSKDKTLREFPVGHIGIFVSSRVLNDIGPTVAAWLKEH